MQLPRAEALHSPIYPSTLTPREINPILSSGPPSHGIHLGCIYQLTLLRWDGSIPCTGANEHWEADGPPNAIIGMCLGVKVHIPKSHRYPSILVLGSCHLSRPVKSRTCCMQCQRTWRTQQRQCHGVCAREHSQSYHGQHVLIPCLRILVAVYYVCGQPELRAYQPPCAEP